MKSRSLCAVLFLLSLSALAASAAEPPIHSTFTPTLDRGAFVVAEVNGKVSCREATYLEAVSINRAPGVPLRVFGEPEGGVRANDVRTHANLNIILRGTAQLDANPQAKAAFEAAAAIWEARIANPITVFVDVDFGTTRFGEPFPDPNIIASANSDGYSGANSYGGLRTRLIARTDNATETAIYAALPASPLPADIGSTPGAASPSILLRTLGEFSATAGDSDTAPSIGFNSAFAYDFDPSNGISPGTKDFEGVVVHEIGHMLGFVSSVGRVELGDSNNRPNVFDWFRFRPGVTFGTFSASQRVQSSGGSHVYFGGATALAMSTGRGDGTGGDEQQASHWKDDAQSGVRIGIMDPTLGSGVRSELTASDLEAFGVMGYNIVSGSSPATPAAPSNLTATATSSTVIRLNWTDNSNNETEFRVELKNGSGTFVDLGSAVANATTINITNLTAGQTGVFRIRARNGTVDSGYSNEASATTPGAGGPCVPNSTTVCLLNGRFRVSIAYVNPFSNPPNQPGTFLAARLLQGVQNPDTALFGFSSAQAVEVVVRVQDTRPFAPRFDLYYGGMTDVGYTVTVTDTVTGTIRQYVNTVGTVGGGVDRNSFPASALGPSDRIISSGGRDSFYDGDDSLDGPGSGLANLDQQAYARKGAGKGGARIVITNQDQSSGAPAVLKSGDRSLSKAGGNAGGGAACSEVEPNETTASANALNFGTPCAGNASSTDLSSITINFTGGGSDGIEDVYKVTLSTAAKIAVTLSFTNSAADLDVYLFSASGSTLNIIAQSNGVSTTESFETASNQNPGTYYIAVTAFEGASNYTITASSTGGPPLPQAPTAPSNLTATATSSSVIRLNWNDNSNDETEFRIEQKVGSNFVDLGGASANVTQVNVTDLSAGQTGTFRVRARNASGDSGYTNEASATTPGSAGCVANSTTVCLLNNRFRVSIAYVNPFSNPPNQPGTFLAARLLEGLQNPDTALFGFSSAQAVEVVVRVQDTRPFAPRFDLYYGGMTDVGYTVTVTDTTTGTIRQYVNTVGTVGGGVDRNSFPAN